MGSHGLRVAMPRDIVGDYNDGGIGEQLWVIKQYHGQMGDACSRSMSANAT